MILERVNVVIAEEYCDRFEAVVRRCKKAGLQVEETLKEIGVVSGRIDAAGRERLIRVKGVAAVERDRDIQIPPPESERQ